MPLVNMALDKWSERSLCNQCGQWWGFSLAWLTMICLEAMCKSRNVCWHLYSLTLSCTLVIWQSMVPILVVFLCSFLHDSSALCITIKPGNWLWDSSLITMPCAASLTLPFQRYFRQSIHKLALLWSKRHVTLNGFSSLTSFIFIIFTTHRN